MSEKTCIICGKSIRTGWKYCFEHRNYRGYENKRRLTPEQFAISIVAILLFFVIIFAMLEGNYCFMGLVLVILVLIILYLGFRKSNFLKQMKVCSKCHKDLGVVDSPLDFILHVFGSGMCEECKAKKTI